MMASVTAFSQSRTYKVKAGETLESIAHKHGISISAMMQANPHAVDNCYTGMILTIPSDKATTTKTNIITVRGERTDTRKGQGSIAYEIEFDYVLISGAYKDYFKNFNCGMSTDIGYRYFLHNNLFVEGLFGYKWYSLWMVNDVSTTVHNLTLPIHVGGHIDLSDNVGLRPFFGPRIDIPVASRVEYRGYSESANVTTGVTLEFGLDVQFSNWAIRTKYGLGVGENKDLNYVSLGAIVGF